MVSCASTGHHRVVVSVLALSVGFALTSCGAGRSSEDDAFLAKLANYPAVGNAWDGDASGAIKLAKKACKLSSSGARQNEVINKLVSETPNKSASVVQTTVSVGILSYCPAALDRP